VVGMTRAKREIVAGKFGPGSGGFDHGQVGCAPPFEITPNRRALSLTGNDPRHSRHHLSLLPSGPDEVRGRLLRGGRSAGLKGFGLMPPGGIQPRISGFRVKGTASSPPSTTGAILNTIRKHGKQKRAAPKDSRNLGNGRLISAPCRRRCLLPDLFVTI